MESIDKIKYILSLEVNYLNIPVRDILIALGIFIAFLILRKVLTKYISRIILKFVSNTKSEIDDDIFRAFDKPVKGLFTILGLYLSLTYLPLSISINEVITKLFRSGIVILLAWGFYNLEGTYSILHEKMKDKLNIKANKIVKPFLSKVLRFITIVIAAGIVAQEFDFNVSGFIAGLGIGGLAVALAAKDTLSNIFGGIVIIVDKPFDIGDWILSGDMEGVVEDINFRSTRIRTFAKALVTVPNSKLVDQPIINYSRRGIRRVTFKLGVTYDTPIDKLKQSINRIEKMLYDHPRVENETIFVKFDEFNDSSLDIFLYFFTSTANWEEYLNIKQEVNFKIMEILEEEGVSAAFPSSSIYFENKIETSK
ncbi:MAG: mechanosensitive ion channel family protein [Firmicutes bacterium]|nr:mechanosensitive ion channel family protein [Bacillota bacterium]